jgi:3-dehydroquinate dehydratase / shikimate dehydrogenase
VATSRAPAGICLCLTSRTLDGAAAALERERGRVDLAELRADQLAPEELPHIPAFAASRRESLILTVRLPRDGGAWRGTEQERAALIARSLASDRFRFVDLEEGVDPPSLGPAISRGLRVIRSIHDFSGVPEGIPATLRRLGSGGAVAKLAAMPRGCADFARLLEGVRDARAQGAAEDFVVLGMGEYGLPTRVLATRLGSLHTYCSDGVLPGAPGQITPRELHGLYRFGSLTASAQVYGVIGNPVAHSKSPEIHNAGLEALGLDAVYLPFLVDDVGAFLRVAELLGVSGVSVTVPHKLAVIPHLRRLDASVSRTGACNTMVREPGGWYGTNTDLEGFLAPLRREAGPAVGASMRATVIGAGGASRAVSRALVEAGVQALVLNRTPEGARRIAEELGCAWGPLGREGARLAGGYADLFVQTTSCGMEPHETCDPLPEYRFGGSELVYELVYRPRVTRLLARAIDAGCRWIGGIEMLQEQARGQFRLFTGTPYPREAAPAVPDETDVAGYNGGRRARGAENA